MPRRWLRLLLAMASLSPADGREVSCELPSMPPVGSSCPPTCVMPWASRLVVLRAKIAAVEGTVSVEDGWPQLTPTRADQPTLDDQTVQDTIRINRR